MNSLEIDIGGIRWILDAQKVVFWEENKCLIVSDTHIGKAQHFRKSGIPIPRAVEDENLKRLGRLIKKYNPDELLILGDLFHSEHNFAIELFQVFRNIHSNIKFILVHGNHDILEEQVYENIGVECAGTELTSNSFLFTHEPNEEIPENFINVFGHIHPGVRLRGRGKNSLKLPCFHWKKNQFVMPAFGGFTGLHCLPGLKEDRIYACVEDEVVDLSMLTE